MADREQRNPTRGRAARTLRLGRVAAGGAVRWAGDRVDGRGSDQDQRRRRGDRLVATIDSLVDQLATMRGAAMKAGQVLSTVEFPGLDEDQSAHLQERLASLRDDVPAVGWKGMRKVLASEWGEDPERVLGSIDPEPAAAASIGQVYRGQTTDDVEVAVKVQYPGIAEAVESDMRNVRMLAPLLRRLMPGLDVKPVLAELSERISAECDYELEASSHRLLARFWRGHPFITVPSVDMQLSRRRVLVSEWVDGIDFAAVGRLPLLLRDRPGARCRAGRPPPGQLPPLRRRAGRVHRLRDAPRPSARLPEPRGCDLRGDQERRRAGPRRHVEGSRLPARRHRLERFAAARAHARRVLVAPGRWPSPPESRGHVAWERSFARAAQR